MKRLTIVSGLTAAIVSALSSPALAAAMPNPNPHAVENGQQGCAATTQAFSTNPAGAVISPQGGANLNQVGTTFCGPLG